jgi:serine phosphatase RsbU (regulator of sigma subunit)
MDLRLQKLFNFFELFREIILNKFNMKKTRARSPVAAVWRDITRKLNTLKNEDRHTGLMYMDKDTRASTLLDIIHEISDKHPVPLGVYGGSLLEKVDGHYKVVRKFGTTPSLRTGDIRRASSMPLEELAQIRKKNLTEGNDMPPVIYRFKPKSGVPIYLKNSTIIGLDDLNHLMVLKQKPHFNRKYDEDAKSILEHLATLAHTAMSKSGKYGPMKDAIRQAKTIIREIIPTKIPPYKGWDIGVLHQSAEEDVGGDYFQFHEDTNSMGIIMADATGHGLPAALTASRIHETWLKECTQRPENLMSAINDRLEKATNSKKYAGVVYVELSGNLMTYAIHACPPPILPRRTTCKKIEKHGQLLGVETGININLGHMMFKPGQTVVLYTDGATDQLDKNGIFWGQKRFQKSAMSHYGKSSQEIALEIGRDIHDYQGDMAPSDDTTLIVLTKL